MVKLANKQHSLFYKYFTMNHFPGECNVCLSGQCMVQYGSSTVLCVATLLCQNATAGKENNTQI